MAITIQAASPHSFYSTTSVIDRPAECTPIVPLCLPVYELADLQFQLIVQVTGTDKDWFNIPLDTIIQTIVAAPTTTCAVGGPYYKNYEAEWTNISYGATDADPDIWLGNFTPNGDSSGWGAIPPGQCFYMGFYTYKIKSGEPTLDYYYCLATCFQRIIERCDTTVLKYYLLNNEFGFYGANNFAHVVRLPMMLRNMQLPTDTKVYQKSDGSSLMLYGRINVEYDLVTDYMPKEWHRKLCIALAADTVQIKNYNETLDALVKIVCADAYELEWPDVKYPHAQGKTKIRMADAINLINNNCQ